MLFPAVFGPLACRKLNENYTQGCNFNHGEKDCSISCIKLHDTSAIFMLFRRAGGFFSSSSRLRDHGYVGSGRIFPTYEFGANILQEKI